MVTVPPVAALPDAAQGDVDPDVKSPVAWRHMPHWSATSASMATCLYVCEFVQLTMMTTQGQKDQIQYRASKFEKYTLGVL